MICLKKSKEITKEMTKLINLDNIPEELEKEIMVEFKEAPCGDRSKLLNYFIQSRLKNLTSEIGEF